MRKILFVVSSLVSVLVEYLIIYLLFRYLFKASPIITYGVLIIIFLVMSFLTITSYIYLHQKTPADEEKPNEAFLTQIIDEVNRKYHRHFKLFYITSIQPNPAWCIGNLIYVNNSYRIDEDYLGGVIAHELGHAISGIGNYTFIASLKPSTMISKTIYFAIVALMNQTIKLKKILTKLLLVLYLLFSFNNLLFVYPFIRNDEYLANRVAVNLGYGNELRCYYGLGYNEEIDPMLQRIDFMHPKLSAMINQINLDLGLTDNEVNFYIINNKLIKCTKMTKTITLPAEVKIITRKAFINPHLKKVSGQGVLQIESGAFLNNLELEELVFPNLMSLEMYKFSQLVSLKDIKLNNEAILLRLIDVFKSSNPRLVKKLEIKLERIKK